MWAVGVVLLEMMSGCLLSNHVTCCPFVQSPLFHEYTTMRFAHGGALLNARTCIEVYLDQIIDDYPLDMDDIVRGCLRKHSATRTTATEALFFIEATPLADPETRPPEATPTRPHSA
jgi:hypothetical protein